MSLSLNFKKTTPPSTLLDGTIPRPFVPSIEPEDIQKAIQIGIITPTSLNSHDFIPKPYIKKLPSWAHLTAGKNPEKEHYYTHQKLIDDIQFLLMVDKQESHDDMLDEASEWLNSQENILFSTQHPPYTNIPLYTAQVIKIVRVQDKWSLGSINGITNVYIPWGSHTSIDYTPGKIVHPKYRIPLKYGELVCADLHFNPQGQNLWKATKIYNKFNTKDMLTSIVQSNTEYNISKNNITHSGYQYNFTIPCDPSDIGIIIGKSGKNINSLIQNIQNKSLNKPHKPMPDHIKKDTPLPEVTITPIEPPNGITGPSSFIPLKAHVRVYCPTCCIWNQDDVIELVSYMHP